MTEAERSIEKAEKESNQQRENFDRNREKIDLALKNAALAHQIARTANKTETQSEELLEIVVRNLGDLFFFY